MRLSYHIGRHRSLSEGGRQGARRGPPQHMTPHPPTLLGPDLLLRLHPGRRIYPHAGEKGDVVVAGPFLDDLAIDDAIQVGRVPANSPASGPDAKDVACVDRLAAHRMLLEPYRCPASVTSARFSR